MEPREGGAKAELEIGKPDANPYNGVVSNEEPEGLKENSRCRAEELDDLGKGGRGRLGESSGVTEDFELGVTSGETGDLELAIYQIVAIM